eukprot:TRINITY_DN2151_c2_g1_i1.p1 TRINITY_DN2151_c2_g1~~TRINITY_DN2151_c2_g1_i1.p1  ORF type:complete len:430 (+),score=49.79 TRINITY_DN2151_c2_g1_i1:37-1290(+)
MAERNIQGLLNMATSDNWRTLVPGVMEGVNKEGVQKLVELMHPKAVTEGRFTQAYANILRDVKNSLKGRERERELNKALANTCKRAVQADVPLLDESEFEEAISRKHGNMLFVSVLYELQLLDAETVLEMIIKTIGGREDPPRLVNVESILPFISALPELRSKAPLVASKLCNTVAASLQQAKDRKSEKILTDISAALTSTASLPQPQISAHPAYSRIPVAQPVQQYMMPTALSAPPGSVPAGTKVPTLQPITSQWQNVQVTTTQQQQISATPSEKMEIYVGPDKFSLVNKPADDPRQRTIYVCGIDTTIWEQTLVGFLEGCGELEKVRLCGDRSNHTVFGFFEYRTREGALNLLAKNQLKLGSYVLKISLASSAIKDGREPGVDVMKAGTSTVRNSNLPVDSVRKKPNHPAAQKKR